MTEQKNPKKTGLYRVIGGSVVLVPPEDDEQVAEETAETVLETTKGAITVKVDGDKDTSQVTDAETEALSNENAAQVREANEKAAEEAKQATQPRKAGDSVVTSGTFNDIDLPEYDQALKQKAAQADEETKKAEELKAEEEAKKAQADEEAFQASLQDVFEQQSEEFVEVHEEDE